MTMLKRATWPAVREALKVDIRALGVPAGMSLARHSWDRAVGDQTPPGPSMLSNRIGGLPVVYNPASGQAGLLAQLPPDPAPHFAVPAPSHTVQTSPPHSRRANHSPLFCVQ